MRVAEVYDLLTYVAAVDNRRFGDDTVLAWHGILAELDLDDCREAVRRHFGQSDDYLKPFHVVRGVGEIDRERRRAVRLAAEAQLAIEAKAPGERAAEVEALIEDLRSALPDPDPVKYRRAETLAWDKARAIAERAEPNPSYDPTAIPAPTPEEQPT